MSYKKRHRKSSGVLYQLPAGKKTTGKSYSPVFDRGYMDGKPGMSSAAGRAKTSFSRSASYPGSFYAHRRRMQVARKEELELVRVFEYNGMHFEIHTTQNGERDLKHIKVVIPDKPSHNAEVIHQFSILNKVRRRQLVSSDFPAAYEREVVDRYMLLNPDEREVVFNMLQVEYNTL